MKRSEIVIRCAEIAARLTASVRPGLGLLDEFHTNFHAVLDAVEDEIEDGERRPVGDETESPQNVAMSPE